MPTKNTRAPISKVQRLKDQGANGSPAYEFATKIARAKDQMAVGTVKVGVTSRRVSDWCNPSKAPPHDPLKFGTPMRYFIGDAG